MNPYNTAIELGMRAAVVLAQFYPRPLDINELVLFDYALVHSSDLGGPESLHPSVPLRSAEIGLRRNELRSGLQVLVRARLAHIDVSQGEIRFTATEGTGNFLEVLESPYAHALVDRARWVRQTYADMSLEDVRSATRLVSDQWRSEFLLAEDGQ